MKIVFTVLALLLIISTSATAQSKKSDRDAKVEQELRTLVRSWDEAYVKGDTATLDRLRELYPQGRFEIRRFRPNIVVKGCGPFAEDTWNKIKVGDVELAIVKPCARCVVTTIDKDTLVQKKEPLKTLAQYRKHELGAIFGQNVIPLNEGRLQLGMNVEVLT
jgi:uncharacterized protein YcbX